MSAVIMTNMNKVIPHLWFDDQAEEAAKFYVATFKDAKLGKITRYPKAAEAVAGKPAGSVMTVEFIIADQPFVALNGGPDFKFTEAISFMISCEDQGEVDDLWAKLTADGGQEIQCGWLKDRYGLSWQIIPKILPQLLGDPDPKKAEAATQAMLQMTKIDIAQLQTAVDQA